MFKKYLIVASKEDEAGTNITTNLSQFGEFKFMLVDGEIIYEENLDLERIDEFDFVIFASRHESKSKEKTLSVHAPGNWRQADFGGAPGKVCKTSAQFQKQLFQKLHEVAKEHNLEAKYNITLECTHHGPLIDKPCVFIEIGSTPEEWKDRRAGFVIAKTIARTIEEFEENPYNEVAIGIGGNHYCSAFNKLQEKSNLAIPFIIPEYALPISEEIINEAWEKTLEEVDLAVIDWNGLGNKESRDKVIEVLDKLYIRYEKTSTISKNQDLK